MSLGGGPGGGFLTDATSAVPARERSSKPGLNSELSCEPWAVFESGAFLATDADERFQDLGGGLEVSSGRTPS